jgi:hypothetical protein
MAYIGTFPSSPGFNTANFRQNTITKTAQTQSGRTVRASNATTLWTGTLVFPTMTAAEFRPVQGFIALTQGRLNEFDIVIPVVSQSISVNRSLVSGSVTVDEDSATDHQVGDTNIKVQTPLNTANVLKAGDVIRFANHTKVYVVTTDCNSEADGQAVINIQPGLVEAVTDGEAVTTNDVPFRMILDNDIQEFSYTTEQYTNYEIDIREVL